MNKNFKIVLVTLAVASLGCAGFSYNRKAPTFIENSFGYVITPLQSFNFSVIDWFNGISKYFKNINNLDAENKELKEDLLEARAELNRLKLIENENIQLESLVKLQQDYGQYSTIGAKVIAKDPGNWFDSFIIDKGTNYGLEKNMVVMNESGLVGKISECGYNYSKVISIINDTDAVSAESLRTNDIGYVVADFSGDAKCKMQYSDKNADILVGDEIVTSHLSEIFPEGISIGHVSNLTVDSQTSMQYAIIEPSVDFSKLKYVLVLDTSFEKEFIENTTSESEEQ